MKIIKSSVAGLNQQKSEPRFMDQQIYSNNPDTKYSELLLSFIQPLINEVKDNNVIFDMLDIGMIAWNIGNVKVAFPDLYAEMFSSTFALDPKNKEEMELFLMLIERKTQEFSEFTNFIDDYEIAPGKKNESKIIVYSQPFEIVMAEGTLPSFLEMPDDYDDELNNDYESGFINRNSITVKPQKPFFEWLNKLYPEDPIYSLDEKNIYLIREKDDHKKIFNWLKKNFDTLFKNELENWHADSEDWPSNRTYKKFTEWFEVEINSMIYDLEKFPVTKD